MFRTVPATLLLAIILGVPGAALATGEAFSAAKQLYKEGQYAEALTRLKEALREEPKEARVRYLLGLTYSKTGSFAAAARSFEEARRLDPSVTFTQRAKFEAKLKQALKLAKAAAGGKPKLEPAEVPLPTAPPPIPDTPRGALGAPLQAFQAQQGLPYTEPPVGAAVAPSPASPSPAAAPVLEEKEGGGPALWVILVLGVTGLFLVVSLVRSVVRRR